MEAAPTEQAELLQKNARALSAKGRCAEVQVRAEIGCGYCAHLPMADFLLSALFNEIRPVVALLPQL